MSALLDDVAAAMRAGHVPLALVVAWDHDADEDWRECADACALLRVLAYTDRRAAVRAACVCARTALRYVPAGESRPLRAIDTAEAWCRGEATAEDCRRAADHAWSARLDAADAAVCIAALRSAAAAAAADDAAAAAVGADAWRQAFDRCLSVLADVVRGVAPVPPSAADLVAAVRREAA